MKQITLISILALGVLLGCNKSAKNEREAESADLQIEMNGRHCAAHDVLNEQLQENPSLKRRMDVIEDFTRKYMENPSAYKLVNGVMEVPVHVNVLWRTNAENISLAQIQSQIDVLNEDFAGSNADVSGTPAVFQSVLAGDTKIKFVWSTTNVTRRQTNKTSWRTNDDMKRSSRGGINPTNPSTTLNIWVCVLANNILGYAQFPGGSLATDGVVVHTNAFGRGSFPLFTAFNRGRTATHEVGHYFNLRHIWGDDGTGCTGSDLVADTPNQGGSNGGCPSFPRVSCSNGPNGDMFMNYMDYTNDACMFMFTAGQKARMEATFALGGPRASLR